MTWLVRGLVDFNDHTYLIVRLEFKNSSRHVYQDLLLISRFSQNLIEPSNILVRSKATVININNSSCKAQFQRWPLRFTNMTNKQKQLQQCEHRRINGLFQSPKGERNCPHFVKTCSFVFLVMHRVCKLSKFV